MKKKEIVRRLHVWRENILLFIFFPLLRCLSFVDSVSLPPFCLVYMLFCPRYVKVKGMRTVTSFHCWKRKINKIRNSLYFVSFFSHMCFVLLACLSVILLSVNKCKRNGNSYTFTVLEVKNKPLAHFF